MCVCIYIYTAHNSHLHVHCLKLTKTPQLKPKFTLNLMASQESHFLQWHFTHELNHSTFRFYGQGLILVLIFFSIIIVAILYLYVRSACFARRLLTTTTTSIHASSSTTPRLPRVSGLDAATIDSLPVQLHRSSGTGLEESECSICLGNFEEEEKVKVLPECQHAYHSECVDKWLTEQSSCPLCRASLGVNDSPVWVVHSSLTPILCPFLSCRLIANQKKKRWVQGEWVEN